MKDYIEERAIGIANYIIDHNATVRQTAKAFGISKSTVHKDVTERLAQARQAAAQGGEVLERARRETQRAAEALEARLGAPLWLPPEPDLPSRPI